jgi:hypothetical protein
MHACRNPAQMQTHPLNVHVYTYTDCNAVLGRIWSWSSLSGYFISPNICLNCGPYFLASSGGIIHSPSSRICVHSSCRLRISAHVRASATRAAAGPPRRSWTSGSGVRMLFFHAAAWSCPAVPAGVRANVLAPQTGASRGQSKRGCMMLPNCAKQDHRAKQDLIPALKQDLGACLVFLARSFSVCRFRNRVCFTGRLTPWGVYSPPTTYRGRLQPPHNVSSQPSAEPA